MIQSITTSLYLRAKPSILQSSYYNLSKPPTNPTTITMADDGRKDFLTKAKEEITPDSSKSTQDKVKETGTDTKDRVTRGVQPDENKSAPQEAFDKAQRVKDSNDGGASQTIGGKVKDALGLGGGSGN